MWVIYSTVKHTFIGIDPGSGGCSFYTEWLGNAKLWSKKNEWVSYMEVYATDAVEYNWVVLPVIVDYSSIVKGD